VRSSASRKTSSWLCGRAGRSELTQRLVYPLVLLILPYRVSPFTPFLGRVWSLIGGAWDVRSPCRRLPWFGHRFEQLEQRSGCVE
jgi:hypothetical protein